MSLKWVEGFENRQSGTYNSRLYGTVTGSPISYSTGRRQGSCLRATNYTLLSPALVSPVGNSWTIGFGIKVESIFSTNYPTVELFSGASSQLRIEFQQGTTTNTFVIVVKRGATTLSTTAPMFLFKWYYVEFQAQVRTGVNGTYEVKVDGVSLVSGSGVDAADTGVDGADRFKFTAGGSSTIVQLDDLYVRDDSTYHGAQVILGTLPNGDGAVTNFLPSTGSSHYALVDDDVNSPSDADDNSSNVDGDVDLYEMADLTKLGAATTVTAVAVTMDLRMRSSGSRQVNVRYRASGGGVGDFTAFDVTSRSFTEKMSIKETNPVTALAWTKTDIDDGQFGIQNVMEV